MLGKINTWLTVPLRAGTFSFAWPRLLRSSLALYPPDRNTSPALSHLDDLGFSSSPSPHYCFLSLFASILLNISVLLSISPPFTTFPSSFIPFRQNYPSFQLLLYSHFHLLSIFIYLIFSRTVRLGCPLLYSFYIGAVACCAPVSILRRSLDFFSAPTTVFSSGLAPTSPTAPLHDFFDPCSCTERRPTASRCCSGLDISISNFLSVVRYTVSLSSLFRQDVP